MRRNIKYRLGLDVGTNSLGWSVLATKNGVPMRVEALGARIFTDGREPKGHSTLKSERRAARSARKGRDRFLQRQAYLLSELIKADLFPSEKAQQQRLQILDPLQLRATALTEKLDAHHIGRALFHINQRRGFKSNRKDSSKDKDAGKVADSVTKLLCQMELLNPKMPKDDFKQLSKEEQKEVKLGEIGAKKEAFGKLANDHRISFGAFLWELRKDKKPTRARPNSDSKLYDFYPTRELLEDEFNKICAEQKKHHPDLLNDEVIKTIRKVIFTQRPLRPQKVGQCVFLPGKKRTYRAMPSFQRFRIYQDVNNLEWTTPEGKFSLTDYPKARDAIVELLEKSEKKTGVTFASIKKELKKREVVEGSFNFNFESEKRKGFDGNRTSLLMQEETRIGKEWHAWTLEKQDAFIALILDDEKEEEEVSEKEKNRENEEVHRLLMERYQLSEEHATACMEAPFVTGTAHISRRAAQLLTKKMRDAYCIQPNAVMKVAEEVEGFINPYKRKGEKDLLPCLPYYGEAFADGRHIIPGSGDLEDKRDEAKFYGSVTNPTVHIALNQIRFVVNELMERYGRPESISIELGRELPVGEEGRREIEKQQGENQKRNTKLDNKLEEERQTVNLANRLRLRLWEELGKSPTDRRCPFSGKLIGITDLFSENVEIEHLIPFSRSLDDSNANKVICMRQANRDKGQRTPYEAFGSSPNGYQWEDIFQRSTDLPSSKQWRFQKDAMKIWEQSEAFMGRHLNDTRYIGRLAKEYLENICPFNKIDVVTGRLTALLRRHWGLNSVLDAGGDSKQSRKNRDDHRHHAVDAVVIGMISRSLLQKVSTAANDAEESNLDTLFHPRKEGDKGPIDPGDWDAFRDDVKKAISNIIVSHRPTRRKEKQLHNETAYGIIPETENKVVWRMSIDDFKSDSDLGSIRSPILRREFLNIYKNFGMEKVKMKAKEMGVRRLRRVANNIKIIPIKDKFGNTYKGYKGDSNWVVEIYQYPAKHPQKGNWDGKVISTFDANRPDFREPSEREKRKLHPAARLVMRLHINDCVEIEKNGRKYIMRLQRMSQGELTFAEHHEANTDKRNRSKDEEFKYLRITANRLGKLNTKKVHISPTGRVSYEGRK